jgi:predicted CoA-binding protein
MSASWQDKSAIDAMLDEYETWAVVGLGDHPWRAAYSVAQDLQAHGKRIVPIHPAAARGDLTVLGEKAYPTLADVPFPIDVVDVFRRSEAAGEFADQATQIGAKGVWFQMGVIDEEAFNRATDAGLLIVMDVCPSREWYMRERSARTSR